MGVATSAALVGAGVSAYTAISEAKKKRDAAKALENLQTPELSNTAENLQVSTLGADLQKEEQARLASTQVDALQQAGTRALVGGLGRVEAGNQRVNASTGADLDAQQKEIDRLKAGENTRIQGVEEQRHLADVSALSSQYNAANQNMNAAIGNTIQSTGAAANSLNNYYATKVPNPSLDANGNPIIPAPNSGYGKRIDQNFQY